MRVRVRVRVRLKLELLPLGISLDIIEMNWIGRSGEEEACVCMYVRVLK